MPYLINMHEKKQTPLSLRIKKRTVIGRDDVCDLQCLDGLLSREHFFILNSTEDEFSVQDNGSSNGTSLNNTRLQPGVSYPLKTGDVITAGRQAFIFCSDKPRKHSGKCTECQTEIHTYLDKSNLKCPLCGGLIKFK